MYTATRPGKPTPSPGSLTMSPEVQPHIPSKEVSLTQAPRSTPSVRTQDTYSNEGKDVGTSPSSSLSIGPQLQNLPSNEGEEVSPSPTSQPSTETQLPNPLNEGKRGQPQPSTATHVQLQDPPRQKIKG